MGIVQFEEQITQQASSMPRRGNGVAHAVARMCSMRTVSVQSARRVARVWGGYCSVVGANGGAAARRDALQQREIGIRIGTCLGVHRDYVRQCEKRPRFRERRAPMCTLNAFVCAHWHMKFARRVPRCAAPRWACPTMMLDANSAERPFTSTILWTIVSSGTNFAYPLAVLAGSSFAVLDRGAAVGEWS
ncbi:hypothetical protein B0H19DRAFT_1225894 [Mycena capillaripes]|nr:hypothetical protein B0H19DRAFT_1225894 [Mycena capillaripes]